MAQSSENSDKTLSTAVPTVNANGIVKFWELEVVYSYPAAGITTTDTQLRRKYNETVQVEYLNKTIQEFTKTELFSFLNISQYDMIFDSTYESVVLPPTEIRDADFDLNSLAA